MSRELVDIIRDAHKGIQDHPFGDLNCGYRCVIYSAMGKPVDSYADPVQEFPPWSAFVTFMSNHHHGGTSVATGSDVMDQLPDLMRMLEMSHLLTIMQDSELSGGGELTATAGKISILGVREVGMRRRVTLAIETARHVISRWDRVYSYNRLPHLVLDVANDILHNKLDCEMGYALKNVLTYYWDFWNGEHQGPSGHDAGCAVLSALRALETTLYDEWFNVDSLNYDLTDNDLEWDAFDAAHFAAGAYADGKFPPEETDPGKRREFWTWWLDEAVPAAWNSVPPEEI